MDNFATFLGKGFLVVGGIGIAVLLLALLVWLAGVAWIAASERWRDICKAESLIHEYRREREEYLQWKKQKQAESRE
mgnify:FL=1|jgi:hypothetical protein